VVKGVILYFEAEPDTIKLLGSQVFFRCRVVRFNFADVPRNLWGWNRQTF